MASTLFDLVKKKDPKERRLEALKQKRARLEGLPDDYPYKARLLKRLERSERFLSAKPKARPERAAPAKAEVSDGRALVDRILKNAPR